MGKLTTGQLAILAGLALTLCVVAGIVAVLVIRQLPLATQTEPPLTVILEQPSGLAEGMKLSPGQQIILAARAEGTEGVAWIRLYAYEAGLDEAGVLPVCVGFNPYPNPGQGYTFSCTWGSDKPGSLWMIEAEAAGVKGTTLRASSSWIKILEAATEPATEEITSTVEATGTPTATQTPVLITVVPPLPQGPACTVGAQGLNVRSGPGTNYPVVGGLRSGTVVGVSGKNASGTWWRVQEGQWVGGGNYCIGNEAAAGVPVFPDPATPTPTATLTPTPTLTPTVGITACGGCRNVGNPSLCHPVDLVNAVPSGAYCLAHGWWDSPTGSGRMLLEAPLLAVDAVRAAKPLRYEGWFSLPASLPGTLGFTNVVTVSQVIDDSHLWGDILDQQPDETKHWWWPASAPITLTVGTAPEPGTITWHATIEVVDLIIGGHVEGVNLTCGGGTGQASGQTNSDGMLTLQWQGQSESNLTCTAQKEGWITQTAMRSGINPTNTEMTIVFVPVIPEGTNKGNWAIEYVALYNDEVGAPAGGIENISICGRHFQKGFIIWRSAPDYKIVPVCNENPRTFWLLTDTWDQVSPIPCDPPTEAGLYLPDRGIGWAWCQQPGLKERLGYSVDASEQCEAADWGRQQRFSGGMLIWVPQWNTVIHLKALGGQWATFDFSPR